MTKNQIDYQSYLEEARHNLAMETETNRNNVSTLAETTRNNVAVLGETGRHNVQYEAETNRHNVATEYNTVAQNAINKAHYETMDKTGRINALESIRHNQATEGIEMFAAKSDAAYKNTMATNNTAQTQSNVIRNTVQDTNQRKATAAEVKLKEAQVGLTEAQKYKTYVNIGTDVVNSGSKLLDSVASFVPGISGINAVKGLQQGAKSALK